jgi:hypothetical protein
MKRTTRFLAVIAAGTLLALPLARAEDRPYTEGHVWVVTMVKVKYGMMDTYLNDVIPMRKKIDEEARKDGLVLSSHILSGFPANREDFDLLLMEEYKNFAAFDGLHAKYEAIIEKIVGPQDKQTQLMVKRIEVREVTGIKAMQELLPK